MNEIKEKLLAIPDRIAAKERELLQLMELQNDKIKAMGKIEIQVKALVLTDKQYMNAEARKNEIDARLLKVSQYQELSHDLEDTKKQIDETRIDLQYEQNQFKAYLAIAGMMMNET